MTLSNKLKIISLLPILLLIVFSAYFMMIASFNYIKADALQGTLKHHILLDELLQSLNDERGVTALYLGSDKKHFQQALEKQRMQLNINIREIQSLPKEEHTSSISSMLALLKENEIIDTHTPMTFNTLIDVSRLAQIRQIVDTTHPNYKAILLDLYTKTLSQPIVNHLLTLKNYSLDIETNALIQTLTNIYNLQENARIERDLLSYYISKNIPLLPSDITVWKTFGSTTNHFNLDHIANLTLRNKLQDILKSNYSKKIIDKLYILSSNIQHANKIKHQTIALEWFSLQTHKMTLLSKAKILISHTLWEKSNDYIQKQRVILILSAMLLLLGLFLIFLAYKTMRDMNKNKDIKNSVPKPLDHTPNLNQAMIQENIAQSSIFPHIPHDISSPIKSITKVGKLLENTQLDQTQNQLLAIVNNNSQNLLTTLNTIKDLSKDKETTLPIEKTHFDILQEFDTMMDMYAIIAIEKNIDLNYYIDPTLTHQLYGDSSRIKQVISSLLSYTLNVTHQGGEINLEITKVTHSNHTSGIKFMVQDNRSWIPKDKQKNLFDADAPKNLPVNETEETGNLGLHISKNLVAQMGGFLAMQSIEGQGTAFFFTLPIDDNTHQSIEATYALPTLPIAKYRHPISSKSDTYFEIYCQHFNIPIHYFDSIEALKELQHNGICQKYFIDIDGISQDFLNEIQYIETSKCVILTHINHTPFKTLGLGESKVLYKPTSYLKLYTLLHQDETKQTILTEEDTQTDTITFNANVLLAEDNQIQQKLIKRLLQEYDINVEIATNGLDAVEKYHSNHYDLLLVDQQMPLLNAIETTKKIRAHEEQTEKSHIPIVVLTADISKEYQDHMVREGIDASLLKPIDSAELLNILKQFLSNATHPQKPQLPTSSTPPKIKRNKKILIAKELILERKLIGTLLENLNYLYDVIDNVSNLEEHISSDAYDIVFSDTRIVVAYIKEPVQGITLILEENKILQELKATHEHIIGTALTVEKIDNIIKHIRKES